MLRPALLTALLSAGACATPITTPPTTPPADAPYAMVLGTAQDGGLPQTGCGERCCAAARADSSRVRRVTSVALVDPLSGERWLLDASPDLPGQLARLDALAPPPSGPGRPPPFAGVFLTHGHMGHYAGLVHLGREAYAAEGQPIHASASMLAFLQADAPWRLLFEQGHAVPHPLAPDEPLVLARADDGTPRLTITALPVPHRQELSDTFAFRVDGPTRSLLYLPDIDSWEAWPVDLPALLDSLDVALVDGTFFDGGELPGRDLSRIPHPFVVHTLRQVTDPTRRAKLVFTHLNHSNPAADPHGDAAARVRAAGARIAHEGMLLGL